MLILSYAYRLGVYLHQFRQGIHEPPSNGNSAAEGHIQVGELFPGNLRGGIDRCAAFVGHDNRDIMGQCVASEALHKGFRFPAGSAVAHSDGLHFAGLAQCLQRCRSSGFALF